MNIILYTYTVKFEQNDDIITNIDSNNNHNFGKPTLFTSDINFSMVTRDSISLVWFSSVYKLVV